MPAVRCSSRIDTFEIKLQIAKRLGSQKADKYFILLTRFLSLKLRKPQFDKLCLSLLGPENLRLHNELIISLIQNASFSNTPPQNYSKNNTPLTLKLPNGTHPRTSLQSLCAFPQSPKKGRTPNLRKFKDRSLQAITKVQEQQSATEVVSITSNPPVEANSVEDGEEVYSRSRSRSPVRAPFGINLHPKEPRKVLNKVLNHDTDTCHYSGQLPASSSLKNRVKDNLKTEGLDVSMDCVNLMNNGLDSFLKRVIKLSLELTRSRSSRRTSMLDFRVATEINPMILGDFSRENC